MAKNKFAGKEKEKDKNKAKATRGERRGGDSVSHSDKEGKKAAKAARQSKWKDKNNKVSLGGHYHAAFLVIPRSLPPPASLALLGWPYRARRNCSVRARAHGMRIVWCIVSEGTRAWSGTLTLSQGEFTEVNCATP